MPTQTSRTSGVDHTIASFLRVCPVDGAHSELTRQRAPLFPRSTQKLGRRLRDADLAESIEGKWRLTEERAREPTAKWIEPLSASHRAHAHA
jgi:hypothetical protein